MSVTRDAAPADPHDGLTDPSASDDTDSAAAAEDAGPPADASEDLPVAPDDPPRSRWLAAVQVVAASLAGSFPVLWILGALPWRAPTLLIENMFRGFASCALADGALNPMVMVCRRAGAPIGMHQLDGGLSYPLGGVFLRLGVEPQAAWQLSVALLILPGIGALFWLLRRMTGSPLLAAGFVALNGLNGTLTARSWNWYWNIVAVVGLPLLFAFLYALYDRGATRRLRPLLLPAAGALLTVLAISIEWQYAGLFAAAVATGAVGILAVLPGWRVWKRLAVVVSGAAGVGVVFAILRVRLSAAGIGNQYVDTLQTATDNAIDLVALIAPDHRTSVVGRLLRRLGQGDLLVGDFAGGRQLWVSPYLGVVAMAFLLVVVVVAWRRRQPNTTVPIPFLVLLITVTTVSVVLSLGPQPHVASASDPTATIGSPFAQLYGSDPLRWIRYPWTWGYLTHIAGMLTCAAVASIMLRRGRRWSPLIGVLMVILAVEFISPQVINAFRSPRPSVAMATAWTRIAADDPIVERFESQAIPELDRALRGIDGPVLMLPWTNSYIAPHLGPESGAVVRNVGIDRNLHQVEDAAPFARQDLRRPTPETLQAVFTRDWAAGVVLLNHVPRGESILRFDHAHLRQRDSSWVRRVERLGRRMVRAGYCVTLHSWFTVISECADHHDLPGRAGSTRNASAGDPRPSAAGGDSDPSGNDRGASGGSGERSTSKAAARLREARQRPADAGDDAGDDRRRRRVPQSAP